MQAKYRGQELNHAWGGRKSNTREINLQNTAFFYCKFTKYYLSGRSVFDTSMEREKNGGVKEKSKWDL